MTTSLLRPSHINPPRGPIVLLLAPLGRTAAALKGKIVEEGTHAALLRGTFKGISLSWLNTKSWV